MYKYILLACVLFSACNRVVEGGEGLSSSAQSSAAVVSSSSSTNGTQSSAMSSQALSSSVLSSSSVQSSSSQSSLIDTSLWAVRLAGSYTRSDAQVVNLPKGVLRKKPVTQADLALWPEFNQSGSGSQAPVELNWYTAVQACNRLSKALKLDTVYVYESVSQIGELVGLRINGSASGLRMPTEVEWESQRAQIQQSTLEEEWMLDLFSADWALNVGDGVGTGARSVRVWTTPLLRSYAGPLAQKANRGFRLFWQKAP